MNPPNIRCSERYRARHSLIFSGGFHSLVFSLCSLFLPGSVVFLLSFPFTFFSPISLSACCSQTTYSVSGYIFLAACHPPSADALQGFPHCLCHPFASLPLPPGDDLYMPSPTCLDQSMCTACVTRTGYVTSQGNSNVSFLLIKGKYLQLYSLPLNTNRKEYLPLSHIHLLHVYSLFAFI